MPIFENFLRTFELKLSSLLSTIASNYTKRLGENKYDDAMSTDFGEKLKRLPPEQKYLLELVLYFFSSLFEQNFAESTALRKYIKEILTDSASEISKRMLNGVHTGLISNSLTAEYRTLMALLCQLDEATLKNIVSKLYAMNASERKILMREFEYLDPEKLTKLAAMNEPEFRQFSEIFQPRESFWQKEARSLEELLRNYVTTKKKEEQS